MIPLWFDGDCMSRVLIDNDYLSDSEELDNDYEKDIAVHSKNITSVCKRQINFLLGKNKAWDYL